jgi:hypothetical protein
MRALSLCFGVFLASGFLSVQSHAAVAARPDAQTLGIPETGERAVVESLESIRQRQPMVDALAPLRSPKRSREHTIHLPERTSIDAPEVAMWPIYARASLGPSRAPQIVSTPNFTGATLADALAFPPDTMGAVGPTQFIVAINGRIRSFNKQTGVADGVLNISTDNFFNSAVTPGGAFTTDPRIRFDRGLNRWIVVMIDVPSAAVSNRVMIAISNSANINSASSFSFYRFSVSSTLFADYPTLGIDANALYIGSNLFTLNAPQTFVSSAVSVVRKSSITNGGPIVVSNFTNVGSVSTAGLYTPQGVDNLDPNATEGYFIGVDPTVFSRLQLRRVTSPAGTPTLSGNLSVTVPTTTNPANVVSSGSAGVDGLDDRLFAAHMRNGRLWTAHNIQTNAFGVANAGGGRTATRWYEIGSLSSTPSLIQSGTVFDTAATPRSYWIPSVMVNGQGHVAMGFSTAASNTNIDAATIGRLSGDTLGSTQGVPFRYTNSSFVYNPASDTGSPKRWGDYSYTSLDPCDDMTMWTIQQFTNAANSYGVQAVRLLSPPPILANCSNPINIAQGASNIAVNLTGSDFFDTDSSTGACRTRASASISGAGLTVNSLTINSPTSATALISASASAALGVRSIALQNPDGQASNALSSCINVVSGSTTLNSLTRASPNPSCTSALVAWNATFASPITGLSTSNFSASNGATVSSVSGSGTSYVVNVNTGANGGTTGLSLGNSNGLSPGVSNLVFAGENYNVLNAPPLFSVTGGGNACSNALPNPGVPVGLNGSNAANTYQLKRAGNNVGAAIAGTGAALAFGNQIQSGTYTVDAAIAGCPIRAMSGSAAVTINQAATLNPVSANGICSGQQTLIVLSATPSNATFNYSASVGSGNVSGFSNGTSNVIAQFLNGSGTVIYNITATANSCPSAAQSVTQQVANPAIIQTSLPMAFVGQSYSTQLSATGVVGTPAFDVFIGTLPPGFSLTAQGMLSGTPTTAGTTNLQFRVRDLSIASCESFRTLSIIVSNDGLFQNGFED